MTPTILRLQPSDAILLARSLKPHVSQEDVTPVICGAAISVHEGRIQAIATDRYTVARIRLPHYETSATIDRVADAEWTLDQSSVIVPRPALEWIAANANRYKAATDLVTIELEVTRTAPKTMTQITITIADEYSSDRLVATFTAISGEHPPVTRLIDNHKPTPMDRLIFRPDLISRTRAGLPRGTEVEYIAGKSETSNKPGPMLYTANLMREDAELVGLIQPNLLARR